MKGKKGFERKHIPALFTEELFGSGVIVLFNVFESDADNVISYMGEEFGITVALKDKEDWTLAKDEVGKCPPCGGGDKVILFCSWPELRVSTIAHECVHVATDVLNYHNVPITRDNDEPLARYVGWLYGRIAAHLLENRKRILP